MITFFSDINSSDHGIVGPNRTGVGSLNDLLNDCLVNGSAAITLTALSVTGGVATGTYGTSNHGYLPGQTITIAGVTGGPSLNGNHQLISASGSTFTFNTTEGDGSCTGTITSKLTPIGDGAWERRYHDGATGQSCFRSTDAASNGAHLWVHHPADTTFGDIRRCQMRAYASMTSYTEASGTEPFPTASQVANPYFRCTCTANDNASPFVIVGDERMVYMCIGFRDTYPDVMAFLAFGDFGDGNYHTIFTCPDSTNLTDTYGNAYQGTFTGAAYLDDAITIDYDACGLMRDFDESYPSAGSNLHGPGYLTAGGSIGEGVISKTPSDGRLHAVPVEVTEISDSRGLYLPGLLSGCHVALVPADFGGSFFPDKCDVVSTIETGKKHLFIPTSADRFTTTNLGFILVDITGPWER